MIGSKLEGCDPVGDRKVVVVKHLVSLRSFTETSKLAMLEQIFPNTFTITETLNYGKRL